MSQESRTVTVLNADGLHARPAMQLVEAANGFSSEIKIVKGEPGQPEHVVADAKSVMSVITLGAIQHTPLVITAEGEDAGRAVSTLAELFERRFGDRE